MLMWDDGDMRFTWRMSPSMIHVERHGCIHAAGFRQCLWQPDMRLLSIIWRSLSRLIHQREMVPRRAPPMMDSSVVVALMLKNVPAGLLA
jgi:hypothetical protein